MSGNERTAVMLCRPAVRSFAFFLLWVSCGSAFAAPGHPPHTIFFNHSFTVLDAETANAIEHSDYLKTFGTFEVRTTTANGGETWTGRYIAGKQTYLEFFGPKDLQGPGVVPGISGLAISPDKAGGLSMIKAALIRQHVKPDISHRTRLYGKDEIPWFNSVSLPGETQSFEMWAMEYLPSYFDDSRTGREPADYPGDISRERYQPDTYRQKLMRDVSVIEIACPASDIPPALALFSAAGFTIRKTKDRLEASDGSTTVILDAVPLAEAGWRRVVFDLNALAADAHIEHIGRSILVVGPGDHAVWSFPIAAIVYLTQQPR